MIGKIRKSRNMRFESNGIILRDYMMSDVNDEVRWSTTETDWIALDTPWEEIEQEDPETIRQDMLSYVMMSTRIPDTVTRPRLEIEADGRHIGFVSSYYLDSGYNETDWNPEFSSGYRNAIGIEICDRKSRNKGYGQKALKAYMEYHKAHGIKSLCIETTPENEAMVHIAEKLGFNLVKKDIGAHEKDGRSWDNLVYEISL